MFRKPEFFPSNDKKAWHTYFYILIKMVPLCVGKAGASNYHDDDDAHVNVIKVSIFMRRTSVTKIWVRTINHEKVLDEMCAFYYGLLL